MLCDIVHSCSEAIIICNTKNKEKLMKLMIYNLLTFAIIWHIFFANYYPMLASLMCNTISAIKFIHSYVSYTAIRRWYDAFRVRTGPWSFTYILGQLLQFFVVRDDPNQGLFGTGPLNIAMNSVQTLNIAECICCNWLIYTLQCAMYTWAGAAPLCNGQSPTDTNTFWKSQQR